MPEMSNVVWLLPWHLSVTSPPWVAETAPTTLAVAVAPAVTLDAAAAERTVVVEEAAVEVVVAPTGVVHRQRPNMT